MKTKPRWMISVLETAKEMTPTPSHQRQSEAQLSAENSEITTDA